MTNRAEFEGRFPLPSNVQWSEEHQNYGWVRKDAFQRTITYRALWTAWKAAFESASMCLMSDRAYRNGLQTGFNMGINEDEQGYTKAMENYQREIHEALKS